VELADIKVWYLGDFGISSNTSEICLATLVTSPHCSAIFTPRLLGGGKDPTIESPHTPDYVYFFVFFYVFSM